MRIIKNASGIKSSLPNLTIKYVMRIVNYCSSKKFFKFIKLTQLQRNTK
jgi:hypothetical protein